MIMFFLRKTKMNFLCCVGSFLKKISLDLVMVVLTLLTVRVRRQRLVFILVVAVAVVPLRALVEGKISVAARLVTQVIAALVRRAAVEENNVARGRLNKNPLHPRRLRLVHGSKVATNKSAPVVTARDLKTAVFFAVVIDRDEDGDELRGVFVPLGLDVLVCLEAAAAGELVVGLVLEEHGFLAKHRRDGAVDAAVVRNIPQLWVVADSLDTVQDALAGLLERLLEVFPLAPLRRRHVRGVGILVERGGDVRDLGLGEDAAAHEEPVAVPRHELVVCKVVGAVVAAGEVNTTTTTTTSRRVLAVTVLLYRDDLRRGHHDAGCRGSFLFIVDSGGGFRGDVAEEGDGLGQLRVHARGGLDGAGKALDDRRVDAAALHNDRGCGDGTGGCGRRDGDDEVCHRED
eukprot:PhM_4_TR12971/c0_g1_i1/m.63560